MEEYLDPCALPRYMFSHDRIFESGEKHVTRVCREDVLILMFSGTLRFSEEGQAVEVKAGEYYIQKHDGYQQGLIASDMPVYYYVHFMAEWSGERGIRKSGVFPAQVCALTQRLDELSALNAPLLEKSAVFYQILSLLQFSRPDSPQRRLAEEVLRLMQANLREGISLAQIAGQLHFSESYLIRTFRKFYHASPHEYRTRLRLAQAERLIRYSDLSLEAIAAECGFGCYANYFKACKKARGVAPGRIAEEIRGE